LNSLIILQQQMEDVVQPLLPSEDKTAFKDWEDIYNQGHNDFKEAIDNNYQMME
jgi:hypothetical protein